MPDLIDKLQMLAARFGHLGLTPDLAAMSVADLMGLYRYLDRLANG